MRAIAIMLLAPLSGCASLAGLETDTQIRIYEGQLQVRGGNILTPVQGGATGHGCIVSGLGELRATIRYRGEKCEVTVEP